MLHTTKIMSVLRYKQWIIQTFYKGITIWLPKIRNSIISYYSEAESPNQITESILVHNLVKSSVHKKKKYIKLQNKGQNMRHLGSVFKRQKCGKPTSNSQHPILLPCFTRFYWWI